MVESSNNPTEEILKKSEIVNYEVLKSERRQLKVFISYSMEDRYIGAKIKETLAEFGIKSFMAHDDIGVSEEWKERILDELNKADIFIPILSENFKNSNWCSQEAGIACFKDILIIPLSIDNVRPYGFMSHRQGKKINKNNIPLSYLLKPIADNFPEHIKQHKMSKAKREKLRVLIENINELKEEYGELIPIAIIFDEINSKYNVEAEVVNKLILELEKQKVIYRPVQGYIKFY